VHRSRGLLGRLGAAILMAGFLLHAGDGLISVLCHAPADLASAVAMAEWGVHDHGPATAGTHELELKSGSGDHDHTPAPEDDPCPFGTASAAVCGGATTAPPPLSPLRDLVASAGRLLISEPIAAHSDRVPHTPFRPPRA
jgi:hypothetical protein